MPKLHFQSPQDMFDVIRHFDLYNPVLEKYIWLNTEKSDDNDYDSIAVHENLTPYQAEKYAAESKKNGEKHWDAYFPPGDYIYQDENMLQYLSKFYTDPNWIIADENYKPPQKGRHHRNPAAQRQQIYHRRNQARSRSVQTSESQASYTNTRHYPTHKA